MDKSTETPEIHEIDLDKAELIVPGTLTGHEWIQRGPWLVCTSCQIEHGLHIGIDKNLVGFNSKGEPILETI